MVRLTGTRSHEQFAASPTPNWGEGPHSGMGPAGVRGHGHSGHTGSSGCSAVSVTEILLYRIIP